MAGAHGEASGRRRKTASWRQGAEVGEGASDDQVDGSDEGLLVEAAEALPESAAGAAEAPQAGGAGEDWPLAVGAREAVLRGPASGPVGRESAGRRSLDCEVEAAEARRWGRAGGQLASAGGRSPGQGEGEGVLRHDVAAEASF